MDIAATTPDSFAGDAVLLGSMNVYDSSLVNFAPGSVYGVRMYEGFSSEEGFPMDFGNVENEGHSLLGVAPIADDNSWAARVPANVPIHLQAIDKFGQALATEPVWTSGRPGEARICGGCHENRTEVVTTQPGLLHAVANGPVEAYADVARFTGGPNGSGRQSNDFTRGAPGTMTGAMGVPWDMAVQPVFDNKCVSCHGAGSTNGWEVQLVDQATGQAVNFSFELTGDPVNITIGDLMITGFSKSYISMAGFMMEDLEEAGIDIVPVRGTYTPGMMPFDYAHSETQKRLNPVQQYPTQDTSIRALSGPDVDATHSNLGLTADQHYILQLAADAGLNWFSRENKP
jgi:hypothetical protein